MGHGRKKVDTSFGGLGHINIGDSPPANTAILFGVLHKCLRSGATVILLMRVKLSTSGSLIILPLIWR